MNRSTLTIIALFLVAGILGVAKLQGWFDTDEQAGDTQLVETPQPEQPEFTSRRISMDPIIEQEVAEEVPTGVEARWADLNQAAIEALNLSDFESAIRDFNACLEAVPGEPVFAANLAEALARSARSLHDSDPEEAIARLERALELAPDRDDIKQVLERWRTLESAEQDFAEDLSEHFRLSYDGDRSDLLNFGYTQILRELETAYQEFGELFGVYPVEAGRARISVVLYHRTQFDAVTGLGDWAGGVFDGTVRVPVEDFAREKQGLTRVLRHELTHAFIDVVGGRKVPGWLNEGLAQLLEWPYLPDRGQAARGAKKALAGKALFPLEDLEGTLANWKDTSKIALAYAQSLAFTNHVERMYGERVLYEMIAGCKTGTSCADTFRSRTGVELNVLLEDLRQGR